MVSPCASTLTNLIETNCYSKHMSRNQGSEQLWCDLSEDQQSILASLREFLRREVQPGASDRDKSGYFPLELVNELGKMGFLGIQVAEAYGGAELDTLTMALIIEEIATVDGSLCLTVASHNSLCTGHIQIAGTKKQWQRYLPDLASGKKLGAWGLTEPGSGSDAAALSTKAEDKGDHFIVNGSKIFITQGSVAAIYVILARTDPPAPGKHYADGVSAFIVEGDSKGLIRGKPEAKLGLKSSDTATLGFENLSVPAENLLGKRGQAFKDVMQVLNGGRIGIAAMGIGLGRGALEVAAKYALGREQFGKPIVSNQAISFKIAEMAMELEAARLLVRQAATLKDAGRNFAMAASMAKLKGSTAGVQACDMAIQILGGYGYMQEYEVERMWRDARLTRIGEGTDEVQHLVIAREYLRQFH
ncbi:MAG: acyl-CoA dehydrogenase [Chloroflexi bacterium AL-N5]|nr:acyl-CoA dehydrogenase [Chloroflexi bacterium AL-N5]